MSDRIIFDDAIEAIAAGAKLSESDKSALQQALQIAARLNELKVYPRGSHTPYDFNNVQAITSNLRFGNLDWSTVKTSESDVLVADVNNWLKENRKTIPFRIRKITDTLFDAELCEREFGSYLLHVSSLIKWAELKGLHIPPTEPPIEKHKFAQVESLLCAIERASRPQTNEQAFYIVQSNPELKDQKAAREPDSARWLLGADAHVKWKSQIAIAANSRELTLLDYASHLPISAEALRVLLASLPEVNSSSASNAQAAAEPVQAQANSEDGETNAIGLIGQKGRQAKTDKKLSHINATNHLGDDEKKITFNSLEEAQASIVLRYAALQAATRLNDNDAVLGELHRLIGCDTLGDPLYSLKSLKSNITKWRTKT